jgi:predicted nucleic-acid-binding Zn-ribbon protein
MVQRVKVAGLPSLPDAKKGDCPKCGSSTYSVKLKFCESDFHADGEHIHVTCPTCGYERFARCLDYSAPQGKSDIVEDLRVRAAAASSAPSASLSPEKIAEAHARAGDDGPIAAKDETLGDPSEALPKGLEETTVKTTE